MSAAGLGLAPKSQGKEQACPQPPRVCSSAEEGGSPQDHVRAELECSGGFTGSSGTTLSVYLDPLKTPRRCVFFPEQSLGVHCFLWLTVFFVSSSAQSLQ